MMNYPQQAHFGGVVGGVKKEYRIMKQLTDYIVKNLKPKSKRYKISDNTGRGLHIVVLTTGTKSWYIKYRAKGKQRTSHLGNYPDVSVKQARDLCFEEHKQVKQGIDVSREKKLDKQRFKDEEYTSLKEITLAYSKVKSQQNLQKGKDLKGRFTNYVFPTFKDIPIKEVKASHLEDFLNSFLDEFGYYETGRRIRQDFINIFKFAVKRDYIQNNVAREIEPLIRTKAIESHPAITELNRISEFGEVIYKLNNNSENIVLAIAIKLLPHVFARPSELRRMAWKDIDFTNAQWTYEMTKITNGFTRKTMRLVPLSSQVVSMLRELYKETGEFDYCFPANTQVGYINKKHLADAVDRCSIDRKVQSIHGFRASARTYLDEIKELGYRTDIIWQQMGHKVFDKNGRAYNRTLFLDERIDMMKQWSDWLIDQANKVAENSFVKRRKEKAN
jgi:integrase